MADKGDGGNMPNKIGERLIQLGIMSPGQVAHVLQKQAAGDARLFGEIAIALGFIDEGALRRYLDGILPSPGGGGAARQAD